MLTTVIGAYPKPDYLKITDWFNAKGGTDTTNPTKYYTQEVNQMGEKAEELFLFSANSRMKFGAGQLPSIRSRFIDEIPKDLIEIGAYPKDDVFASKTKIDYNKVEDNFKKGKTHSILPAQGLCLTQVTYSNFFDKVIDGYETN